MNPSPASYVGRYVENMRSIRSSFGVIVPFPDGGIRVNRMVYNMMGKGIGSKEIYISLVNYIVQYAQCKSFEL